MTTLDSQMHEREQNPHSDVSWKSAACSPRRYARWEPRAARRHSPPAPHSTHRGPTRHTAGPAPGTAGPARSPAAIPRPGRAPDATHRLTTPVLILICLRRGSAMAAGGGRRDCAAPRCACAEPPARAAPPERAGAVRLPPARRGGAGRAAERGRPRPSGPLRRLAERWACSLFYGSTDRYRDGVGLRNDRHQPLPTSRNAGRMINAISQGKQPFSSAVFVLSPPLSGPESPVHQGDKPNRCLLPVPLALRFLGTRLITPLLPACMSQHRPAQ